MNFLNFFNPLDQFIFPAPLRSTYRNDDPNLLNITAKDNHKIPCFFLPYNRITKEINPKAYLALFFHGNAEDIGRCEFFLREIQTFLKVFLIFTVFFLFI